VSKLNTDLAKRHESEKYSQNQGRQNRLSSCSRILARPSPTSAAITNQAKMLTSL
jgi:hypothetical protein